MALDREGAGAIAYGEPEGPLALRAALAQRIAAQEGAPISADEVVVTGGNSQALEQAVTAFTVPGDIVFVESPTYNLALGILRDHPVEISGLRHDAEGLDVDDLEAALARLRADGRRARLLYTDPDLSQPDGRVPRRGAPGRAGRACPARGPAARRGRRLPRARLRGRRPALALEPRPRGPDPPSGDVLQVADAGAARRLGDRPRGPSPALHGHGHDRERRVPEPVRGDGGGGAARRRRLRDSRRRPARRLRRPPRRPRRRPARPPAGRLRFRRTGRRLLPLAGPPRRT